MSYLKYDQIPVVCQCQVCGREWNRGDMGDNESICFRCEREEEIMCADIAPEKIGHDLENDTDYEDDFT